ncbi:uncharacterized protein N7529_009350 [Penicillium soppii]|uniref:uncharacterized protein n=1 Tax=Penicillium soppii TaxID=69789 RepID=UPI0025490AA7|nr:uncharacterized protein N7529_009350 [Penicillium soppii]KAJ5855406.1 hypothetical protein N7529_009350 [Penicillium soppii]
MHYSLVCPNAAPSLPVEPVVDLVSGYVRCAKPTNALKPILAGRWSHFSVATGALLGEPFGSLVSQSFQK